jgi:hypothetical protein
MDLENIKNYDEIISKYFDKVLGYLPNILLAIVIFIVGCLILKITT